MSTNLVNVRRDAVSNQMEDGTALNQVVVNHPGGVLAKLRVYQDAAGVCYISRNVDILAGGVLDDEDDAAFALQVSTDGLSFFSMAAATGDWTQAVNVFTSGTQGDSIPDATSETVVDTVNAILALLRATGQIAPTPP